MGKQAVNKLKTQFLFKDVTDTNTVNKGIILVKEKLASIGIDFTFEIASLKGDLRSYTSKYTDTAGQDISFTALHPASFPGYQTYGADNVCLVYDWTKVSPQPSNPVNHGKHIQMPVQFFTDEHKVGLPEVFAQFFLHEICHDLKPDLTHNQYQNAEFNNKQPIDYYLHLLGLYYKNPITTSNAGTSTGGLIVTIARQPSTAKETIGQLMFGDYTCKTLERPWLNNARNISCIPKGTYTVKWTFSPKFMRYTYEVQNVPNRSGIRIHKGNYFFDVQGCILLGTGYANLNNDKEVDIINSAITIKAFEQKMGKKTFTLIIK